jgi:hypothetical protein
MAENRKQDRREKPASLIQSIKNLLYKLEILVMHPSRKAKEEYRDNLNERDRRNRRTRRNDARDDDRRTGSRRD